PSVSPRSNPSSPANFAFSSAIIARSRSRTSLRPTCFILVSGKPCRSRLRSQQVTVTPVGGDPQYLLQLLQSQPRYPFELRRQCLPVRRCYLHHRFLLHDHRQTYRWIAPIAFERLLAPTHQPRPPPSKLAHDPPQPPTGSIGDRNAEMHRE